MTLQTKKKPFWAIKTRRLEIMLCDFTEKIKPFFTLKTEFFQSLKNRTFPKRLNLAFGQKMPFFFVYVDLEKIRLKIMLTDFHRKKKPF